MRMYLIILIGIQILFLQGCKHDNSATENQYAAQILSQVNPSDTFLFDFPSAKDQLVTIYFSYLPLHEKWLNLQSLHKGYDSIEIRVWYGCEFGCGRRLVRLFHNREKWQAEISTLTLHGGGDEGAANYIDSMSREIEFKSPKSGWVRFINSLFDLKILVLPNDYDIPNFKQVRPTDGDWIQIEISAKNIYRFYGYTNPDFYDYWQVQNVLQILKLLSTEFNISEWPDAKMKVPESPNKEEGKIIIHELNLDSTR